MKNKIFLNFYLWHLIYICCVFLFYESWENKNKDSQNAIE